MKSWNRLHCLFAVTLALSAHPAMAQDLTWNQPLTGNVVYGPIGSGEPLPDCPDCDCGECRPGGLKGCLKRVLGWGCKTVSKCRRRYYQDKQIYHMGYTPPVLPPYCQWGYGYYETSWRPSPVIAAPCETPPFDSGTNQGLVNPLPVTPPQPVPSDFTPLPHEGSNSESPPLPSGPAGDEKPRYEEPKAGDDAAAWKKVSSSSKSYY